MNLSFRLNCKLLDINCTFKSIHLSCLEILLNLCTQGCKRYKALSFTEVTKNLARWVLPMVVVSFWLDYSCKRKTSGTVIVFNEVTEHRSIPRHITPARMNEPWRILAFVYELWTRPWKRPSISMRIKENEGPTPLSSLFWGWPSGWGDQRWSLSV